MLPALLPMTATAWSVFLAASLALAAVGTECLDRPFFEAPRWSRDLAAASMWSGRAGV